MGYLQPNHDVKMYKHFVWSPDSENRNNLTIQYEPLQPYVFLAAIRGLAGRGCVVFDVGANIGAYSILAQQIPSVEKVYAFEAEKTAYGELCKNIKLNNVSDKVEPHFLAVSDHNGEVVFGVQSPMAGINGVMDTIMHKLDFFKEQRKIQSVALDAEYCFQNRMLFFKIDVEGHESAVIKGADNLFSNNRCFIQIEIYRGQERGKQILAEHGYKQILKTGPDCYFTNLEWTATDTVALVEDAVKDMIKYNTARY